MILLYAEDPGAANFAGALSAPLEGLGAVPRFFAEDHGATQLARIGIAPEAAVGIERGLAGASAVVVGTSENRDSRAHRIVSAARERGVASIGLVDAPSGAADRFRGIASAPLAHAPDWLLVPDEATRDAYAALGYATERIRIVGQPHFDQVSAKRVALDAEGRAALRQRLFPAAREGTTLVVFLAELSDGLEPADFRRSADYRLRGWGDDDRRTHIVLQDVLTALDGIEPCPETVLRLHPKNEAAEFARYGDRIGAISTDEPADEVVYAADLVIGMSTILLAEAALLGRPVLSVLPREAERAWLPAVIGPRLPCVTRAVKIRPAIERLLAGPGENVVAAPGSAERAARAILEAARC